MRSQPSRLGHRTIVPLIATALLTAGAALVAVPGAAQAASPAPWAMNALPTPPAATSQGTTLLGVAAVSPTEVWSVGRYRDSLSRWHGQMVRYNGTAWQQVALPTANEYSGELTAIDATGPTNVWAVGSSSASQAGQGLPLILKRANGVWNKIPAPALGAGWNWLGGVDMLNASSGWAVGSYQPTAAGTETKNLILRWNGSSWTSVPAPSKATGFSKLTSVVADGPYSAWAVGSWAPADQQFLPKETVILHWNGSTWTKVPSPNPSPDVPGSSNTLNNVIAVSPTEIWATGQTSTNGWINRHPLNLRWTGGAWTEVTAPVQEPLAWEFTDAFAVSPTEVYFVGYKRGVWDFQDHDFIRRWDGTQFNAETLAMPANKDESGDRIVSAMGGISGLPSGQLFAVGHVGYQQNHALTKNATP